MSEMLYPLPADLPIPEDDGAADHLIGLGLPELVLESSLEPVDIALFTGASRSSRRMPAS